jgi:MFS family permease
MSVEKLDRKDTLGLLLLSLGVALIVVDMSIVNLVLPQIARDLELGFSGLQYVSALFSLAAAAVVVAAGDVADGARIWAGWRCSSAGARSPRSRRPTSSCTARAWSRASAAAPR